MTADSVVDTMHHLDLEGNAADSSVSPVETTKHCAARETTSAPAQRYVTVNALLEAAFAVAAAARSSPVAAKAALRAEGAVEFKNLKVVSAVGGMPSFPLGFNWYHHPVEYCFFTGGACECPLTR